MIYEQLTTARNEIVEMLNELDKWSTSEDERDYSKIVAVDELWKAKDYLDTAISLLQ